jgi:signal transduction histidine kinase
MFGDGKPIDVIPARDAGEIRLQVRDHGLGISANDQARISEQFERLVTGRPTSGFGLGLWVVGQLTEAMGGSITVEAIRDRAQHSPYGCLFSLGQTQGTVS